jgi:carboxypeptidase C (cathepsin A)
MFSVPFPLMSAWCRRFGPQAPVGEPARHARLLLAALFILLAPVHSVMAQAEDPAAAADTAEEENGQRTESPATAAQGRLPAARHTLHRIHIDGEELRFAATAGAITLTGNQDRAEADLAYVAYTKEGTDPAQRPVTFAVNGGPGASSAYLHIGVLGPWLLPMEGERIIPSQSVELVENAETWLEFTDLVFVDPVGTGFSRLVNPTDQLRNRYLSVDGDIEALSRFVLRWLTENGRLTSPKYFLGESYGGFRGPLLAEALQTEHGVGLKGMILLSPVLDFGWWAQPDYSPLPLVSLLPSLAAAGMEREDAFSEEKLHEAEAYASGQFAADLLQGVQDGEVVDRVSRRVAELTGLPPDAVRNHDGRIRMDTYARELERREGRVPSNYDTTISGDAPVRGEASRSADAVLDAMKAPLTSAMLRHYRGTLQWLPERSYQLLNSGVNRSWNWGRGRSQPEAVSALRRVLALDPEFRVLVVHGYTDLVTPYFASKLILRQIRSFEPEGRVRQENYRGGHMFYTRGDSRRAFRDDALQLYRAGAGIEEEAR